MLKPSDVASARGTNAMNSAGLIACWKGNISTAAGSNSTGIAPMPRQSYLQRLSLVLLWQYSMWLMLGTD